MYYIIRNIIKNNEAYNNSLVYTHISSFREEISYNKDFNSSFQRNFGEFSFLLAPLGLELVSESTVPSYNL